jgi:hypothetical protein
MKFFANLNNAAELAHQASDKKQIISKGKISKVGCFLP